MPAREYHGADASITVATADGTSIPVAELLNVNVREQVEVDELRTADSIKLSEVKQRNYSVLVEATYVSWDLEFLKEWHAGSGGTAASQMNDTSDPTLFDIDVQVTQHGQSTDTKVAVTDCYIDDIPVFAGATHEAWIENDFSAVGKDLTLSEV